MWNLLNHQFLRNMFMTISQKMSIMDFKIIYCSILKQAMSSPVQEESEKFAGLHLDQENEVALESYISTK